MQNKSNQSKVQTQTIKDKSKFTTDDTVFKRQLLPASQRFIPAGQMALTKDKIYVPCRRVPSSLTFEFVY